MMKMLEMQVGQLAGRLTTNEGKLLGQPKGPETAKAIQTRSGKETEDSEHRLSINMLLLDALQVPTYSRYFKNILANKYEIETLGVDHVKMSEQCSAAIANGLEKQKRPRMPDNSMFCWFIQVREGVVRPWS
jgi:hypothetical protein